MRSRRFELAVLLARPEGKLSAITISRREKKTTLEIRFLRPEFRDFSSSYFIFHRFKFIAQAFSCDQISTLDLKTSKKWVNSTICKVLILRSKNFLEKMSFSSLSLLTSLAKKYMHFFKRRAGSLFCKDSSQLLVMRNKPALCYYVSPWNRN